MATPNQHLQAEGSPGLHNWLYQSFIGQLFYLAGATRPDIAFATQSCVRAQIISQTYSKIDAGRMVTKNIYKLAYKN